MEKVTKYPDRELIRTLRSKFVADGIDSMTQQEMIDLINHQHEYIATLKAKLAKVQCAD